MTNEQASFNGGMTGGLIIGACVIALIYRLLWATEVENIKRPETAWRIYQESKIDESARLAKEKIQ